jgi:hypothetical protein
MIVWNIGKEEYMFVIVIQFLSHLVTSIIPFFILATDCCPSLVQVTRRVASVFGKKRSDWMLSFLRFYGVGTVFL